MGMTLKETKELAAEHFIVGFEGTSLRSKLKKWVRENRWGGYLFLSENYRSPKQLYSLIQKLKEEYDLPPFLAVDHEGGTVLRFRKNFTPLPSAEELGRIYEKSRNVTAAYQCGSIAAKELRAVGIVWALAPVLDIGSHPGKGFLASRTFGNDAAVVQALGLAFIAGLQDNGVMACAKHFPGHGCTSADSHEVRPTVALSLERLEKVEMEPFIHAIENGVFSLMMAHITYNLLDPENPASLSRKIHREIVRKKLRFEGMIVSDDLSMKAITDHLSIPEAAIQALSAGADLIIIRGDRLSQEAALEAVEREIEKSPSFRRQLKTSSARLQRIQKGYLSEPNGKEGDLQQIGAREHLDYVKELRDRL